jgi:hypothetical protein
LIVINCGAIHTSDRQRKGEIGQTQKDKANNCD